MKKLKKTIGLTPQQKVVSKNVYGKVISPTDKGFIGKRQNIQFIIKTKKPSTIADTTKIPGVSKRYFTGITKEQASDIRTAGTRRVGKELASWGHSWNRDNKGRLYLGFSGSKKDQNKTISIDKAWFYPKKKR